MLYNAIANGKHVSNELANVWFFIYTSKFNESNFTSVGGLFASEVSFVSSFVSQSADIAIAHTNYCGDETVPSLNILWLEDRLVRPVRQVSMGVYVPYTFCTIVTSVGRF